MTFGIKIILLKSSFRLSEHSAQPHVYSRSSNYDSRFSISAPLRRTSVRCTKSTNDSIFYKICKYLCGHSSVINCSTLFYSRSPICDRRFSNYDPLRFDGHPSVGLKARPIQSSTKSLNPSSTFVRNK